MISKRYTPSTSTHIYLSIKRVIGDSIISYLSSLFHPDDALPSFNPLSLRLQFLIHMSFLFPRNEPSTTHFREHFPTGASHIQTRTKSTTSRRGTTHAFSSSDFLYSHELAWPHSNAQRKLPTPAINPPLGYHSDRHSPRLWDGVSLPRSQQGHFSSGDSPGLICHPVTPSSWRTSPKASHTTSECGLTPLCCLLLGVCAQHLSDGHLQTNRLGKK